MRMHRIKEVSSAFYHIVSRIVDRRMILNTNEKERLRQLMRRVERFSGVQVLTWTCLDNHFHILLHVPERSEVPDEELLSRLRQLYEAPVVQNVERELKNRREQGLHKAAETLKAEYTYRMYDISEFMKTFKQRFTQSYNSRHGRKGTLWEERFKSILLQGRSGQALATIAAYIDLNAVRAGLVEDPKEYRFSGYGEAVAGSGVARAGLSEVMLSLGNGGEWREVSKRYREFLYRSYVEDLFLRYRSRFGVKRETGARPMRGGFPELFTVRRLRLAVITVPSTA